VKLLNKDQLERESNEFLRQSDSILQSLEEDHRNEVLMTKTHINSLFDKNENAGEYVEKGYSFSYTTILFILTLLVAVGVFFKYYKAKKTHML
jgi:hypothetical protein